MRVTDGWTETEAFATTDGRATLLGGGTLTLRDFYRLYGVLPDRRNSERRQTRERRRIPSGARRRGSRRRRDALTTNELIRLCLGMEFTV
jgi:hypothetical protein